MGTFISSGAFKGVSSIDELLPKAREHGLMHLELSSGLKADGETLVERLKGESDFRFLYHNYFPAPARPFVLNLADADDENRRRSIEFCNTAMEQSALLGLPFFSVHAGFVTSLKPEDLGRPERQAAVITSSAYEAAMERFEDSVVTLKTRAAELDVALLLENNVDAVPREGLSHLLLVSGSDALRFFEKWGCPEIGLLLDVAHLRVSATHKGFDAEQAVEVVAPWIRAVHLSDNDGFKDSNQICREESWFWRSLQAACSPEVTVVLEAYGLTPEVIHEQCDLIHQKLPFAAQ